MIARLKSPAFLIWLGLSLFLVWLSRDQILTRSGWDPDDQLRMVQLRDFLGGQSWFDTTQYRLNAPDGGPMHWSRLIELPLAALLLLLTPLFGQTATEMLAGTIVPLGCFGLVCFALSRVAAELGGRAAALVAVVMTMVSPAISMQLRPMRIDHHGWQLVCAALSLWTLFWPAARKAGMVMGLALAVWLHISLEGAPVTAAFFGLLGWRWAVSGHDGARLGWTVASFALASLLLFFGTQAPGLSAPNYCDTISPAHIFALATASLIITPAAFAMPCNRPFRIATLVISGLAAIGVLLWQAPVCADGAFSTMDPVVREYWYVRVNEGMPVWHQKPGIALSLLGVPLAGLAMLLFLRHSDVEQKKADYLGLVILLVYSSLLALLVFRTISVATMFAVPLVAAGIALLFRRYRQEQVASRRIGLVALMILLLMPGAFISMAAGLLSPGIAAEAKKDEDAASVAAEKCESIESVKDLAKLKQGNMVAPFDIGPAILLTTRHSVLASSHHRNEAGMRDHIDIYRLPAAQAHAIIQKRKIDYVVACTDEAEMRGYRKRSPDGLWAQLASGRAPVWLRPLPDVGQGLKVWQVRSPKRD